MITPRPYQEDSLERIWRYFQAKSGNPLIAYPTGTGKSLIPAVFIERILKIWPNQRFLIVTHVKELIQQNYEVMKIHWPEAPAGIYSAGLKQKDIAHSIIFGGVQSMIRNAVAFGHRDICFIDEAHLVSPDDTTMYQRFLATMKLINPRMKIIGLSATPFRMGQGLLTDGGLFTDIIHNLTACDDFNKLIADGYLCPLVPRRTHTELDVSNVSIANGEFVGNQLQAAVDVDRITHAGIRETCAAGTDKRSWLIFASGIKHAEHIAGCLRQFGVDCAAVHSKQSTEFNDRAIRDFKSGTLRAISNYSKLTTGFNHPSIDLIADFRPTMSIPLHIQKLGRGTRMAPGKQNCVVLDFSRNVPRLGPINDPIIPKKRNGSPGDVPVKICDACGTYNHTRVQFCTNCGHEFQFQIKLVPKAGTSEIIKTDIPIVEWFEVNHAYYMRRQKNNNPPYIRATYQCGLQSFSENVFPEGQRYAKHLFHKWWLTRHAAPPPSTADEVLYYIAQLRCPKRIKVHVNKKFPEIMSAEY